MREYLRFFGVFDPSIPGKRNIEAQSVKPGSELAIVESETARSPSGAIRHHDRHGGFRRQRRDQPQRLRPTLPRLPGLIARPGFRNQDFRQSERGGAAAERAFRAVIPAPDVISIGANADPYQPVERELKITRSILEVLAKCGHPFGIITKNALIERDIDLLAPMAEKNLARASVSVTNLDNSLARRLEPRASAPMRRLEAIRRLSAAGIPARGRHGGADNPVFDLPVHGKGAGTRPGGGATMAGYVLLRLPNEVAPLFKAWLELHYPTKAAHTMSLIHQMRGGRDYDSTFGMRHRGSGTLAELIARRFQPACERLGFTRGCRPLDTSRFRPPKAAAQLDLF